MKWKLILAVLCAGLLAGCANTPIASSLTPAQQTQDLVNQQTRQYQECLIYYGAQPVIAQKVKTLPIAQATTLYDASLQATKYCGTVLTNNQTESDALAKALTTVGMEAGINFALQGAKK